MAKKSKSKKSVKSSVKRVSSKKDVSVAKPSKPGAFITIGHMDALKSNSYMINVFALIGVLFSAYLSSQYYSGSSIFNLIVLSFIFLLNLFTHRRHKTVVRMTFFASLVSLILSVSVALISADFLSVTLIGLSFLILLFSISNLKYGKYSLA